MTPEPPPDLGGLPPGWSARVPARTDVPALVAVVGAHRRGVRASARVDPDVVEGAVAGTGSWTRRQVVVADGDDRLVAWASVHDRAAGRTLVEVSVGVDVLSAEVEDRLAAASFGWAEAAGRAVAAGRGLPGTQLDSGAESGDARQRRWLDQAGYRRTRTWLQMSRPVRPEDADLPAAPDGVRVRRVATHDTGLPVAQDLQTVHRMLEESFADHFNSYRESFPEFLLRLREDPGHRWDLWWVAEVHVDGGWVPGGALVGTVLPADGAGAPGSYVDYIGVHRTARGRGVAKALLRTVVRDAAGRGHDRVGLEVDGDSPTGADGLYRSTGWTTSYETQSWHRDVVV